MPLDVRLDPGDCPVCGTAHCACKGEYESAGVGTTHGVVVRNWPFQSRSLSVPASVPAAMTTVTTTAAVPRAQPVVQAPVVPVPVSPVPPTPKGKSKTRR